MCESQPKCGAFTRQRFLRVGGQCTNCNSEIPEFGDRQSNEFGDYDQLLTNRNRQLSAESLLKVIALRSP